MLNYFRNSRNLYYLCNSFQVRELLNRSGLTGFDSGLEWYVSTRSVDDWLINLSCQQINWRKQLRSRCLTELQ